MLHNFRWTVANLLLLLLGVYTILYTISTCEKSLSFQTQREIYQPEKPKFILLWNSFFSAEDYNFGFGNEPFVRRNCEVQNCFVTKDQGIIPFNLFDAVVVHGAQYSTKNAKFPTIRSPQQIYAYYSMEAPINRPVYPSLNGLFNLTITHRLDSDIPIPYFHFKDFDGNVIAPSIEPQWRVPDGNNEQFLHIYKRKTIPAAWFSTNCHSRSRREHKVKELKKFIRVDAYGKCGNLSCPRTNETACFELLSKHYYFYLAYENSICDDYISEKSYNPMKWDTIPVLITGANITRFLPPGSYIDARQYTEEELANKMNYLIKNPDEYIKYFWWRKYYKISKLYIDSGIWPFCDLCKILHNSTLQTKIYDQLSAWWHGTTIHEVCLKL